MVTKRLYLSKTCIDFYFYDKEDEAQELVNSLTGAFKGIKLVFRPASGNGITSTIGIKETGINHFVNWLTERTKEEVYNPDFVMQSARPGNILSLEFYLSKEDVGAILKTIQDNVEGSSDEQP